MTQISYDHGVSGKKLLGETIGAFFDRAVETWRDREALVVRQQNVRWTWGELGRRVDDLAAGLLSLGLERGDRVRARNRDARMTWCPDGLAAGLTAISLIFWLVQRLR